MTQVISYKAQSPDESCLVTLAAESGFVFKGREHNHNSGFNQIIVDRLGWEDRFDVLNVLEFDSDRKRMSVLVRSPNERNQDGIEIPNSSKLILFCKGADSVIFERLDQTETEIAAKTEKQLDRFGQEG